MTTIIFTDGKQTQRIEPSNFAHEGRLQQYISENPECLPVTDIDDDAKLMIVGREFPTNHGPIDVLGVDANGNIYIVETKLYKNPDKRKVIAQLFDYGASLWKGYDSNDFTHAIDRHLLSSGQSLVDSLAATFDYDEDEEPADTVTSIQQNLQEGRFRFIVLMDHIDDRLKTLISFVNANSRFDIYAVELKYYKHTHGEVLIPELFGVQIKKPDQRKPPPGGGGVTSWNFERFFADAKQRLREDECEAVTTLYNYSLEHSAEIRWGRGKEVGTFHPKFSEVRTGGKWWSPFSVSSDGTLVLNFRWGKTGTAGQFRKRFLAELAKQNFQGLPHDTEQKIKIAIGQWKEQTQTLMSATQVAISECKQDN